MIMGSLPARGHGWKLQPMEGEMIMGDTTTVRDTVRAMDLTTLRVDAETVGMTWGDAVEAVTVLAMQLGYRCNPGTGGAYAQMEISTADAAVITDMMINVDPVTGAYLGDRDTIATLASDGIDAGESLHPRVVSHLGGQTYCGRCGHGGCED